MRIVQVGLYPMDSDQVKGGVEASVYGLSVELAKMNEIFVIDIPRTEVQKDFIDNKSGLKIFRFYSKKKKNIATLLRMKDVISAVRNVKPDICHIHGTSLFSLVVYLFTKLSHIPSIVTVHGLAHIEKRNIFNTQPSYRNLIKYIQQSLTEFFFLSLCKKIIVDTQYVANAIALYKAEKRIFRMPHCFVIPQGVNSQFYQLDNLNGSMKMLSVGAFTKRKGHLQLLESMLKVKLTYPDFSLIIAGSLSDKSYLNSMREFIMEKDLTSNIRIYPNASLQDILSFYSQSSIFLLHTEEESQGIVFCEAMAARLSIVSTNAGGVSWVVKDNVNGLLCDFGDTDSFANNIVRLLKEESLQTKLVLNNKIESQKYNWKFVSENVMDLYKTMI